jgi:hypothetical protein
VKENRFKPGNILRCTTRFEYYIVLLLSVEDVGTTYMRIPMSSAASFELVRINREAGKIFSESWVDFQP